MIKNKTKKRNDSIQHIASPQSVSIGESGLNTIEITHLRIYAFIYAHYLVAKFAFMSINISCFIIAVL